MNMKNTVHISPSHSPVLKRWKDLSPTERHREIVRCAANYNGHAVSLNLSPSFQKYLRSSAEPMRQVGKRMNMELNSDGLSALPALMVLETTGSALKTHLHGVFVADETSVPKIQRIMRRAGGYIRGKSGSRQFKAKSIYQPDGWTNYISKDCRMTRRLLALAPDDRLWWVSRAMTQLARDYYECMRKGQVTTGNLNTKPAAYVS